MNSSNIPRRNILLILPEMIKLIPKEESNLKSELENQLVRASFTAPENIFNIWLNVQDIISSHFNKYDNQHILPEWSNKLINIWTNKK